jgi:hypothetical protein
MSHMLDYAGMSAVAGHNIGNSATGGIGQGTLVERATAVPAASGASEDLFSVTGGPILIQGFVGEVTVVMPSSSIDFAINHDPDGGGSNVALATALVCDADPVGTFYVLNDTFGGVLIAATDTFLNAALEEPFTVGAGDILLTVSGGGTIGTTARVKWSLWYTPLASGVAVVAV